MAEDKIALGEISPEDQERLRQEQEEARRRKAADRGEAEAEQIAHDSGGSYEKAVVMGDVVEPSIPPPTPGDVVSAEDDSPR